MKKSELRKKFLHLRKKKFNNNIIINPNKFLKFLEKKNIKSKNFGGYYPFNYELNILNILESLEKKRNQVSLPRIDKNNNMFFFQWSKNEPLKINKYGIPEPTSKKKIIQIYY